jgi:predicted amidohydrolase
MRFNICERPSRLMPVGGKLKLNLMQASGGADVAGYRDGFAGDPNRYPPTSKQISACAELLRTTQPGALNVISFVRGMIQSVPLLEQLSKDRAIVTLAGPAGEGQDRRNLTFIAENGAVLPQAKLSLASEDQRDRIIPGTELNSFTSVSSSPAIRWAVLNCHDYTNVNFLLPLLERQVELIVVVTRNNATRLYWEYGVADIHRLFCYVVIVNVSEVGGSGVFAPFRHIGFEEYAVFNAGGRIFGASGPAVINATIDLEFDKLREMRRDFRDRGLVAVDDKTAKSTRGYTPTVPSEHYVNTFDRDAGPPPTPCVEDVPISWEADQIRVAVAQLNSMPTGTYVDSKYRIRNHPDYKAFKARLRVRLDELKTRCELMAKNAASGNWLDLLVLPEVFIPRPFMEEYLRPLGEHLGATVICGVDYPGEGEAENANECAVLRPGYEPVYYRKVTRSQYDAHSDHHNDRMPMQRGTQLKRFVNKLGRGFGVLICYDFSHLDLMTRLNLHKRAEPLEVVVVVAHNPFGALYRTCCIADSHRFYQYIVMCNVAKYGGSGVYAPCRTQGPRQTLIDLGTGGESIAIATLDLAGLRAARQKCDHDLNEGAFMRRPGIFQ